MKPCRSETLKAGKNRLVLKAVTRHVTCDMHYIQAAKPIFAGAKLWLAARCEQREERRKAQEKGRNECNEKNRKQQYTSEKWDKEMERKIQERDG